MFAQYGILATMSMQKDAVGIPTWTLSDRLRKARESRGLSQQELADASHGELSVRTISNYESQAWVGKHRRAFIRSWAFATGVPIDWLLNGTSPGDPDGGPGLEQYAPRDSNPEPADYPLTLVVPGSHDPYPPLHVVAA